MGVLIITGCSGRVGMAVMKQFAQSQYTMVGFDVIPPKKTPDNFEFVKVDLTSDLSVQSAMSYVRKKYGNTLSSIIHLAAYYNFTGGNWEMYEKLTIEGTRRLLQEAKKCTAEQFLFSSSILANKPCKKGEKITEKSPLSECWEYPKSKVITEKLLRDEHQGLPLVILRIAGCYDDECHSIPISNQIQRIYEHQFTSRVFPGDITHGASFLHLDDLAECIFLCVQKRSSLPKETILLVGEEETLSYDELQREIAELINGKPFKTLRVPKWFAKLGTWMQNHIPGLPKTFIKPWMIDLADENYELDMSYTEKQLHWKPKHELKKVLPIMIKSLLKDPKHWYQENGLTLPCRKKTCGCK